MTLSKFFVLSMLPLMLALGTARAEPPRMSYHQVIVDGVNIAYREIGDVNAPAILLLHGVPSSSRMYDGLMRRLGDRFHMIAPDYPGFGNSDAPTPEQFVYTFDHYATLIGHFTDVVGLKRYVLFMQDYGAPVGMRLAIARPGAVTAMVFQNGNVYADGLGKVWETRKAYWADRNAYEARLQAAHLSMEVTRQRHIGSDPDVGAYNPDLWQDEVAFLNRPGEGPIQMALIYDYRTNLDAYPAWQKWLREHRLPTLVIWGKHDLAFTVEGAQAFRRDLPDAEIDILDGGHFVMDTRLDEVASLTCTFLDRQ
ncbi:alpha/beta fold hydrolase [Pseudomonas petrae]|uniref:Alpha/beta hydrolase n=1 Tax=Pseudomonas petrae TaxID=2912190 RepID=A0ABS9IA13_9PSED|nr:alpha/beta hydrolase [Pseudomonas petrae]MCF7530977.1 alpha/beta hydrolase [Pseudomonas petrae]MCF7536651.1 alpha/beta hydrolase [Pseudomonas petrae]MCF7544262.1 alpha/beta hydrolase [Pseudomonas petrae]MCF7554331.1 alpha/beta hydrolase [Pseudomonas petrae]